jgi:serine/threonine-protein kinase
LAIGDPCVNEAHAREAAMSTGRADDSLERSVRRRVIGATTLLGTAACGGLLALYQWMELLLLRAGQRPFCALGDALDCGRVWDSPFASGVHALTGVPVAGWGLAWSATAFVLAVRLVLGAMSGRGVATRLSAVRLWAAAGAAATAGLVAVSASLGAFCLTCIGTYVLVLGWAAGAFLLWPHATTERAQTAGAAAWPAGVAVAAWALLLVPGLRTPTAADASGAALLKRAPALPAADAARPDDPKAPAAPAAVAAPSPAVTTRPGGGADAPLPAFLAEIPEPQRREIADVLRTMKRVPARPVDRFQVRQRKGPPGAPVQIVEFTDILCGHCRRFVEAMDEVATLTSAHGFSLEPRHFPLDHQCNPHISFTDGSGVRCLAARAMICREGDPGYWAVQKEMFEKQDDLTKERILEIAARGTDAAALRACIDSDPTTQKLQDDLDYASLFDPDGTPLVIANGHKVPPLPLLLYALIATRGNLEHPDLLAIMR